MIGPMAAVEGLWFYSSTLRLSFARPLGLATGDKKADVERDERNDFNLIPGSTCIQILENPMGNRQPSFGILAACMNQTHPHTTPSPFRAAKTSPARPPSSPRSSSSPQPRYALTAG